MAVTLRLSLVGKKGQPIYRIVAAEKRSKRDGKQIAILGSYDPNVKPPRLQIDQAKFDALVTTGAQISLGLRKILKV